MNISEDLLSSDTQRKVIVFLILAMAGMLLGRLPYRSLVSLYPQIEGERLLVRLLNTSKPGSNTSFCIPPTFMTESQQVQVDQAIRRLEVARSLDPNSGLSLMLLGKAYCWLGEPERAIDASLEYVTLHPRYLPFWRDLGQIAQRNGQWDEAVQIYQQALDVFPNTPDLHVNLGNALYERGDGLNVAMREMETAISLDPQGQFYVNIGELLTKERRFEEADVWYRRGIEVEPGNPWWHELWADSTLTSGDLRTALKMYQEIIGKYPDFSPAYFEIAAAYRLSDQRDSSIESIQRAILLMNPPDPWYYIRAGEIYEWAGRIQEALESYRQALALDSSIDSALRGVIRLSGQE